MEVCNKRGRFYSHLGEEMLICCWGIRAPQQPTGGPSDSTHLKMRDRTGGDLLVGNLKACLAHPKYPWEEYLETVTVSHGLSDQAQNFTPRQRYRAEGN